MFCQASCWEIEPSCANAVSRWLISFGERLGVDRSIDHFEPIIAYQVKHFPTVSMSSRDLHLGMFRNPIYMVFFYPFELQYLFYVLFVISFSNKQTLLVHQAFSRSIVNLMRVFSCDS